MGNPIRIVDMAKELIYLCGKRPDTDIPIVYTGLRPGEKLFEELLLNEVESPTRYNDILVARPEKVNFENLRRSLQQLLQQTRNVKNDEAMQSLRGIVRIYDNSELAFEEYAVN